VDISDLLSYLDSKTSFIKLKLLPTAIAWLGLVKYAHTLQVFYFTLKLLGYTAYLYWG